MDDDELDEATIAAAEADLLPDEEQAASGLQGQGVMFVGKLAGMPRREAQQLVREHGGLPLERFAADLRIVVVADDFFPWAGNASDPLWNDELRAAADRGDVQVLTETQLWQRLGLVDDSHHVHRLYTPAMLADLLGVKVEVIRRWHRRGLIVPSREVQRLPYFDFQEVATARRLAELLAAGVSPQAIERQLADLKRMLPEIARPLTQLSVIVQGKQLLLRQGEGLLTTGGQRLLDFDTRPRDSATTTDAADIHENDVANNSPNDDSADELAAWHPPTIRMGAAADAGSLPSREQLLEIATDFDDRGQLDDAIEVYRTLLTSWGANADACFRLAELLYRRGDAAAARERYFMAIELDEEFVEARANLGCVLAEEGQTAWAIAAFEGALASHGEYPDAHYHLARLLDETGRGDEAGAHWRAFLDLAPESPWAEVARQRLAARDEASP